MLSCEKDHVPIAYDKPVGYSGRYAVNCPLCLANERIAEIEEELKKSDAARAFLRTKLEDFERFAAEEEEMERGA